MSELTTRPSATRLPATAVSQKIRERLDKINTNEIGRQEVYDEYKSIAFLVERAAKEYSLSGDLETSRKYWSAAASISIGRDC
jgi:hypothetical protein